MCLRENSNSGKQCLKNNRALGGNKIKNKLFKIYAICNKNDNSKAIVPWKEFLDPQAALQRVWKLPPKQILEVCPPTHTHTHTVKYDWK